MAVIEKITEINDVLKDIFSFTQNNTEVKADFDEYLATIGSRNIPMNQMEKIFLPYIFERKLNDKFILEMYQQESKYQNIVESLLNAQASIFEIKKILKNGFEFYNIINEKTYTVTSLMKMTAFRGVGVGCFVVARIVSIDGDYYLLEISGVLPSSRKTDAYRFAVAKIIQNPELVYLDNPEKQKEIEDDVADIYKKFMEFFGTTEIVTTNKYADDLIGIFNDYAEEGKKKDYTKLVKELQNKLEKCAA